MSIPWRNLGLYYWVVDDNHAKSESSYRKAIEARPTDQTLYRDLAMVLVDSDRLDDAITLLENMKYEGTRRSDVIIDLAQNYLDAERYDKCVALLSSVPYFVNWEGSSITWNIFNKANVGKGLSLYNKKKYKAALKSFEKALTFPDNLGVGQSHRTEEAEAWYWKGKTLEALGKSKEANSAWKNGALSLPGSESQNKYKSFLTEMKASKPTLTESIEGKVAASVAPSSKQTLDEAKEVTAYANDAHINKMKRLIEYVEKRGKKII